MVISYGISIMTIHQIHVAIFSNAWRIQLTEICNNKFNSGGLTSSSVNAFKTRYGQRLFWKLLFGKICEYCSWFVQDCVFFLAPTKRSYFVFRILFINYCTISDLWAIFTYSKWADWAPFFYDCIKNSVKISLKIKWE